MPWYYFAGQNRTEPLAPFTPPIQGFDGLREPALNARRTRQRRAMRVRRPGDQYLPAWPPVGNAGSLCYLPRPVTRRAWLLALPAEPAEGGQCGSVSSGLRPTPGQHQANTCGFVLYTTPAKRRPMEPVNSSLRALSPKATIPANSPLTSEPSNQIAHKRPPLAANRAFGQNNNPR
jgi:hypothetical protein